MAKPPDYMSNRPFEIDEVDVVSDILLSMRFTAEVFGRFEFGAPWAVRVPRQDHLSFYVIAQGGAWLEVESGDSNEPTHQITLSAGDVALLPRGSVHVLRDPSRSAQVVHAIGEVGCPRPTAVTPVRFGGDGPVTSIVVGAFRFGVAARSVLLESLPPVLHIAAGDAEMSPQLAAAVQLILAESAAPGPGSTILSARLAEILLIHALRARASATDCAEPGLRALSDPAIGTSLRIMHARSAEAWTVDGLARAVNMSRSGFAARFTELVGEPPLHYLTGWRMTEAARLLREREESVPLIAEQVGYGNPAAFMKAFARVQGVGPGAYRRAYRLSPSATSAAGLSFSRRGSAANRSPHAAKARIDHPEADRLRAEVVGDPLDGHELGHEPPQTDATRRKSF
jgi:AraC-like DNA-binding protein